MPKASADASRKTCIATALIALATMVSLLPAHASSACSSITAPALEIQAVDCQRAQVWSQLQASQQFPDIFAGSGKMTNLCYKLTAPAMGYVGNTKVTITSSLSGWTTDFTPVPYGGTDNLATVVTQLTIAGLHGNSVATLYTRDTIDFSQIFTTGTAPEEDVIVGGHGTLENAKGTYRAVSIPEDTNATKIKLTNLTGVICP
jgi:hypothetical protein